MGDEAEALACYSEAFASDRANLDCVSWLGAHHVRRQDYLAAVPYFEAAGRVQPREASAATSCWLAGWVEAAFAAAPVIGALLPLRCSCEKRLLPLLLRGAWGYAFCWEVPRQSFAAHACQMF
jgi:tetratricopeptide (TPR) repeat protein